MKTRHVIDVILSFTVVILFIAAGLTSIIFKNFYESYDGIILGTVLSVAGSARIISYLIRKGWKKASNLNLVTGIAMIALAIVFFLDKFDIQMLCFGWGIMEIVLGLIEIQVAIYQMRKEKIAILEALISIGSIVFGILLCLKLYSGLGGHLIYLGISFILMAALELTVTIRTLRINSKKKTEE